MRKKLSLLLCCLLGLQLSGCTLFYKQREPTTKIVYRFSDTFNSSLSFFIENNFVFYPDGTVDFYKANLNATQEDIANSNNHFGKHTFSIPTEYYLSIEREIYRADFFTLPEDLGVNAMDAGFTSLTVETEQQSHTTGGESWPRRMNGIHTAIWDALDHAIFEDPRVGDYTETDATIAHTLIYYNLEDKEIHAIETIMHGNGDVITAEYGPFPPPFSAVGLDFERDESTLIMEYSTQCDIGQINALLQTIEQDGFLDLPEMIPSLVNGKPADTTYMNYKDFITVTINGESHTRGMVGAQSFDVPEPFANTLASFQEVIRSTPATPPPTIESLLNQQVT